MAVKIRFDSTHNPIEPTLVLATRSGRKLGKLPALNLKFGNRLNDISELFFRVNKVDCIYKYDSDSFHKMAFSVHNVIGTETGFDEIGTISQDARYELDQYIKIYNKLSNVQLKLSGEIGKTFRSPAVAVTDNGDILFSDNGHVVVKISGTKVYLNDPKNYGLPVNNSCMISLSFDIPVSAIESDFWNQIIDFKLVWVKEWDRWFEISVELSEDSNIIKNVTAKSLGASELSQININGININNETDILRDDYEPTVLFDEKKPDSSLLHRLLKKAPHYTIGHVDNSIASIIRTFSFDNMTIYDALNEVAQEIDCLISIDCKSDKNGKIVRQINVYDLEAYCLECGARGNFVDFCDKCNSANIRHGYGNDTSIYISVDNLADSITYKTDVESVKNCFRLEGGDDLMTATIANCNPNGTNYIWYISDDIRSDMSHELRGKLDLYDSLYNFYQNEYVLQIPDSLLTAYNNLIDKYKEFTDTLKKMPLEITGYPALMQAYYDTIDLYYFLNNSLMPSSALSRTTAELQTAKLNYGSLSPVAVKDLAACSLSTANSAVLAMAKTIVDPRYQVKIKESTFVDNVWNGVFTVTNYSDEEDTADSARVSCLLNSDYEAFVTQRITKLLSSSDVNTENTDVVSIFKLPNSQFETELKKYCLQRLISFRDCCQGCLDIMIQQGLANSENWEDQSPDLYRAMYVPYYEKLGIIEQEVKIREAELKIIAGSSDSNGVQYYLETERQKIQDELNFEQYLGDKLLMEFAAYRREDVLKNTNFVSDGLDNTALFSLASEFIETAKKEIIKSATLQHSISASLRNLLVMREFAPITDYFELGNWIKVCVDSKVYKLRLIYYEIDFDDMNNIEIEFSDVKEMSNYVDDAKSLMEQMSSMATSYGAVMRQAKKGDDSNKKLANWVDDGLSLTKMKIVDSADNQNITWDNHGLLCTEYLPITDSYDEKQLKIINRGLYLTDDNWRTSKAGIGDFVFWNPETRQLEEGYGVIADKLVGNLILGKRVGIYNTANSITMDENGFILTADKTCNSANQIAFAIQKRFLDGAGNEQFSHLMYLDTNGELVLNGSIKINSSGDLGIETLNDLTNAEKWKPAIHSAIHEETQNFKNDVEKQYVSVLNTATETLEKYKAEIGQYMQFNDDGLTLGAKPKDGVESRFKTVIDNKGMYFKEGGQTVSYISNNQLFINDAVIKNSLILGKFFFSPRQDGGVSLTWQGETV